MLLSTLKHSPYPQPSQQPSDQQQPACYFSYVPPSAYLVSAHFSVETPTWSPGPSSCSSPDAFSDPTHPLLAQRVLDEPVKALMEASRLLQLQTAAAYGLRPGGMSAARSVPSSSRSSSSSSAGSLFSSTPTSAASTPPGGPIRCSRCHCESTHGSFNPTSGMVSYGANLYYCNRCADLVGYRR